MQAALSFVHLTPLPFPNRRTIRHCPISMSQTTPRDWEKVWHDGVSPGDRFDARKPLPYLTHQLHRSTLLPRSGSVLIPGCGRGYDVQLFASTARYQVTGLEISQTAVDTALDYLRSVSPTLPDIYTVVCADFFTYAPSAAFDVVYDYTFLCAIEPSRREQWARCMARLVRKGGCLITAMFPLGKDPQLGGPPFGLTVDVYRALLEDAVDADARAGKVGGFEILDGPELLDDAMAHEGRGDGQTAWAVWRRVA